MKNIFVLVFISTIALQTKAQLFVGTGTNLHIGNGSILTANGIDVTSHAQITGVGTGKMLLKGTAMQNLSNNGFKIFGLEIDNTANVLLNHNLEIDGALTLTNGALQVNGKQLTLSGTASCTAGTLTGSSLSELIITGTSGGALGTINFTSGSNNNLFKNLTLNRSGSNATATLGNTCMVSNLVTLTSGTLNTGGNLVLKSDATGTASIPAITGAINGNVTAQRYIPGGRRAFRFVAHPFSNAIPLSQLATDIDITGTGGTTNGFTNTVTNAASAFWYDVNNSNGSSINDIGWTAFTNTNGIGNNAWSQYKVARILVRGAKGEGLSGSAYTPSATTLNPIGLVNTGNQTINLIKSTNSGYNVVGNPYPSQINVIPALQAASNIGSAFWVWDANQGTRGGYTSSPIASTPNYILPMHGAIIVNATANTALSFTENHKSNNTAVNLFRTNGYGDNSLQLRLESDSIFWDRVLLFFNPTAQTKKDKLDAEKLHNADVNFYTLTTDSEKLSIDTRPYTPEQAIPLAIYTNAPRNYSIHVSDFAIDKDKLVFLHDKYLQQWKELTNSTTYNFEVTTDSATQGVNRFEIVQKNKPLASNAIVSIGIHPNPTTNNAILNYSLSNVAPITIQITNIAGQHMGSYDIGKQQTGNFTIGTKNWSAGVYVINFKYGTEQQQMKLVKQ